MDTSIPTHHLNFKFLSLLLVNLEPLFSVSSKFMEMVALLEYLYLFDSVNLVYVVNWLHVKANYSDASSLCISVDKEESIEWKERITLVQ